MNSAQELELLLGALSLRDLRELATDSDVPKSGTKPTLVARLAEHYVRMPRLVCDDGPWTRTRWNEVIEQLGGTPRRSWADVRAEMKRVLRVLLRSEQAEETRVVKAGPILPEERIGNYGIASIRSDHRLASQYAAVLGLETSVFLDLLTEYHGDTAILGVWPLLEHRAKELLVRTRTKETQSYAPTRVRTTVGTRRPDPSPLFVSETREPPRVGDVLSGRFEIRARLGSGGFGTAFEVHDRRLPTLRLVAKLPRSDGAMRSLDNEIERARRLIHTNLCQYREVHEDARFGWFIVMDYAGTATSDRYRRSPAPLQQIRIIVRDCASALDYMHGEGVVHGDVSPQNILVDERGVVRLTDFGISSVLEHAAVTRGVTMMAPVLGRKAGFSAPEVFLGRSHRTSDQYSLAKSIECLLVGVETYLRNPDYRDSSLPARARSALDRSLHSVTSLRFATCRAFAEEFEGGFSD